VPGPAPIDPAIRYHAKVNKRGPDDCWPWTAGRFESGYGAFRLGSKQLKAHRFGYQLLVGPIPDGLYVLHHCDNPPCQNPNHWFLGTHKDNADDRQSKGRGNQLHGEACPWSVLTDSDIREIRQLYHNGSTQYDLADRFHVHQKAISMIVRGKRWSHLDGPITTINRSVRLTVEMAGQIRALYDRGASQQSIADSLSISQSTVSDVVRGRRW